MNSTKKKSVAVSPSGLRSQEEGMRYLRKKYPNFFTDPEKQQMAAIIIREMGEELALLPPVQRAGLIACIIGLMYQMGTAAIKAIRDPQHRGMTAIFLEANR